MRAIVIGGCGFIGSEIVRDLLRRGDEVFVFDHSGTQRSCDALFGTDAVAAITGDILDRKSLEHALHEADEVYHLAGKLGTSELDGKVRHAIEVNIIGAVNVFEAAIMAEVPTVFYPSKPNIWLNTYTVTKHASEQLARLYMQQYPIRICSLRYFNAYGPRQALYPVRKIIPAFAAQAIRGMPVRVYGDGEQTVDMVYSMDLGPMTVDFVRSGYMGKAVDCGRGIALTVNEVAWAVNEHFGNRMGITHVPMRRGEIPGTTLVANTAPLEDILGKLVFSGWEESLTSTLEWYAALEPAEIDTALIAYGVN
jgi:UDP-glucose 4-epimerase